MDAVRKPYEGPEPYIFVSYAHADRERVYPLLAALQGEGYRVWYDQGIPWSTEWADVIAEHIAGSAVVLAFHSEASKDSRNCKEEIYYTLRKEKNLVSAYLDGVQLAGGLEMRLAPYQAVKMAQYPDAAAFVARMGEEEAFAPCREPEWHKTGQIQWKLDADGVLTIAKNEDLPDLWDTGSIPDYQYDPVNESSTGPWMPDREKIHSVVIANDIRAIGDGAFRGCTSLTAVTIPDSVTKIGDSAFRGCTSLTALTIPESVTDIGESAFEDCTSLTALTIPDSVEDIGDEAFWGCTSLTAVTIPNSVTQLGEGAFWRCTSLTAVTIPDSVTLIGDGVFWGCTSLTAATIPDSVTQLGWSVFNGCTSLTSLTIPDSVEKIGDWAFNGCTNLTAVTIPDSVTAIGGCAFAGCPNLHRMEVPAGADVHPEAFDPHTQVIRRSGGES